MQPLKEGDPCETQRTITGGTSTVGRGLCKGAWRETLYRGQGLEKKDLLPVFLPVVLSCLSAQRIARGHRWDLFLFLILFPKSLPSAHNNGVPTCLRPAKVPVSQSDDLKGCLSLLSRILYLGCSLGQVWS